MRKLSIIFCVLAVSFAISCSTENETIEENVELNNFKKSNDFKTLESSNPLFTSNLDLSSFDSFTKEGTTVYGINVMVENKKLGTLTFVPKGKEYITIVESFNYNQNNEIIGIDYKNASNEIFVEFETRKNLDGTYSLKGKRAPKEGYSFAKRGWWSCTGDCITDAASICFDDFDCGMTCGILAGVCADSIVAACAIWCGMDSDNDLDPNQ